MVTLKTKKKHGLSWEKIPIYFDGNFPAMVAINVYKHIINKHPFTMDVPLFSYIYIYGPILFPLFIGYFPAATMTRKIFISRTLPVGKTIQYYIYNIHPKIHG